MIILETRRLILRHFTLEDAPLIIALNTPKVLKYVHEPIPKGLEDAERIIRDIIMPQYSLYALGRFAIHLKEDNRFIGWCGLKFLKEDNTVDLGYRFMEKEWGKGFATESATACLEFGFTIRNLQKIYGKTHANNIASQNVLQKIGMVFEHTAMEDMEPIKIFSLTNEGYGQKKEGN